MNDPLRPGPLDTAERYVVLAFQVTIIVLLWVLIGLLLRWCW